MKFGLLPVKLQSELHGPWVGLDIGNSAEVAASPADAIGFSVWSWRQAPASIRKSEVLMVKSVEDFPAEFEILTLRNGKLLEQGSV